MTLDPNGRSEAGLWYIPQGGLDHRTLYVSRRTFRSSRQYDLILRWKSVSDPNA
jgi:hypothetical protein